MSADIQLGEAKSRRYCEVVCCSKWNLWSKQIQFTVHTYCTEVPVHGVEVQRYIYTLSASKRGVVVFFSTEKIQTYCLKTTMIQPNESSSRQIQNESFRSPNKTGRCCSFNIHTLMPTEFCLTHLTWKWQLSPPVKCFWEDVLFSKTKKWKQFIWKGAMRIFYSRSTFNFLDILEKYNILRKFWERSLCLYTRFYWHRVLTGSWGLRQTMAMRTTQTHSATVVNFGNSGSSVVRS